ncbi:hypothetical protein R77567_01615 [Ralstonia sp. LMG 32965]|uniref:Uncharacterized protein n=1 Tax=Ralstonia flatus TaxID=3058601 RepID=A0AAD2BXP9_9RALS|nr:hypothetical protein [Ralstonia sp. LMG 32965]MBN6211429.1 hypothetical protein [Ralstonia pickettii]CAJ0862080.1 hypothetical protein R77567_01615 [Ralstonia sp. LMG 32965]
MQPITIQGREFVPMKNGTFAHDIWITRKTREAGLADIRQEPGESHDQFIERIAAIAWGSGAMLEILGGTLLPAGMEPKDWTPEVAAATGAFFGSVTDEASKRQLRSQIGGVIFLFFVSGLSSSETSPKSSPEMGEDEPHATGDASTWGIGDT